jgi:large subunit ribosomal protein L15
MRPGFEGGQLPIIKRLPRKRGFTNRFRKEYSIVKLGALNVFESNVEVTVGRLLDAGIVKSPKLPLKVLADGEIKHPLIVKADRFSAAAKAKLEAAGGKALEVGNG